MSSTVKNAPRKFVDLVFTASSKYANWDPSSRIEVGDYGRIQRETGTFKVEGNIYTDPKFVDRISVLSSPVEKVPESKMTVSSFGSVTTSAYMQPNRNATGLVDLGIGGSFSFARRRGALIVLAGWREASLPDDIANAFIDLDLLKGYSLITSTVSCRGYALTLSNTGGDSLSVFLKANGPLPQAQGLVVGGRMPASWEWKPSNRITRDGWNVEGNRAFVPLFTLKNPKRHSMFSLFRGDDAPPEPEGFERLEKTNLPWGALGEDGESDEEDDE